LLLEYKIAETKPHLLPLCAGGGDDQHRGVWVSSKCLEDNPPCRENHIHPWVKDRFIWQPKDCRYKYYSLEEFKQCAQEKNIKHILFFGDSLTRNTYFTMMKFLWQLDMKNGR
jgi:hypothetical protein